MSTKGTRHDMDTTIDATTSLSRRSLLRRGGMLAVGGGVLAACGGTTDGSIARIGRAPEPATLESVKVDDVVLLRTAMSMELLVVDLLSRDAVTGAADPNAGLVAAFVADHRSNRDALAALASARGGEAVDEPNAKLMSVWGERVVELVAASDRGELDVLVLTHGLEDLLAATHQTLVPAMTEAGLRARMAGLAAASARRAAVVAQVLNPGTSGFAPGTDDEGNPTVATLPTAFGQTVAPQVVLGPETDGVRATVVLDTPGPNSFVY